MCKNKKIYDWSENEGYKEAKNDLEEKYPGIGTDDTYIRAVCIAADINFKLGQDNPISYSH